MIEQENKIRYALADDHTIFRQGLKMILSQYPEFEFVCEAENGEELLQKLEETPTEIVLLDLSMPVMDGIDTAKNIADLFPKTRVLILSMHDEEAIIAHAMQMGANGFMLKNSDPSTIAMAIHSIIETGYYFNDVVSAATIKKLITQKPSDLLLKTTLELSEKELTILRLICEEKTSAEIGEKIYLSTRTVEGIRTALMDKLGARNIAGLVAFAYKNGLVS